MHFTRKIICQTLARNFTVNNTSSSTRLCTGTSRARKLLSGHLPHLHLRPPLGVTPFEFRKDFYCQKTRVHGLSCGVVGIILRLAKLVEHRLVTDTDRHRHRHTDRHRAMAYTAQSIARAVRVTPVGGNPDRNLFNCNLAIMVALKQTIRLKKKKNLTI